MRSNITQRLGTVHPGMASHFRRVREPRWQRLSTVGPLVINSFGSGEVLAQPLVCSSTLPSLLNSSEHDVTPTTLALNTPWARGAPSSTVSPTPPPARSAQAPRSRRPPVAGSRGRPLQVIEPWMIGVTATAFRRSRPIIPLSRKPSRQRRGPRLSDQLFDRYRRFAARYCPPARPSCNWYIIFHLSKMEDLATAQPGEPEVYSRPPFRSFPREA